MASSLVVFTFDDDAEEDKNASYIIVQCNTGNDGKTEDDDAT